MKILQDLVPPVRHGFWTATLLALLGLIGLFFHPFGSVQLMVIFTVVAWGIRRGQSLAAITGVFFLVGGVVVAALRWNWTSAGSGLNIQFAFSAGFVLICAFFLFSAAKALRPTGYPGRRWPWFAVMGAAVVVWLTLRPFVIPTGGMEDTVLNGDHLLIETVTHSLGRLPKRGEIVAFQYPVDRNQIFLKRIAGVPGDRIRIRDKELYRNGSRVEEPYASHKTMYIDSYRDNFPSASNTHVFAPGEAMLKDNIQDGEVVVPAGKYFVMGDNRDSSLDSRYWGFVTNRDIIGRPVLVYESFTVGPTKPASILTIRWARLFKRV